MAEAAKQLGPYFRPSVTLPPVLQDFCVTQRIRQISFPIYRTYWFQKTDEAHLVLCFVLWFRNGMMQ